MFRLAAGKGLTHILRRDPEIISKPGVDLEAIHFLNVLFGHGRISFVKYLP
ncbi:MAG: hypothetical protein JWO78_1404 [Micavibrio sp.]|nr:hypothetical protein [Micavibrio sp.]